MSISEIIITPLKRIPVQGGDVLHAIKKIDPGFLDFGEAYFSFIENGVVKGWKRHLKMTLNLIVPIGSVRFIFFDESGVFREECIGIGRYSRITVPPRLWFAFQGLSDKTNLILNIADIPHCPEEVERKDLSTFLYGWSDL